jgi:hypothetical protein
MRLFAVCSLGLLVAGCNTSRVDTIDDRTAYVEVNNVIFGRFDGPTKVTEDVWIAAGKAAVKAGYDYFMIESDADTSTQRSYTTHGQINTTASVSGDTLTAQSTFTSPQTVTVNHPGELVKVRFYKASEIDPHTMGLKDAHFYASR